MKDFLHRELLSIVAFVTKKISRIRVPFLNRKITSKDYRAIQPLMIPGQTILSKRNGELSTLLIPGDFTHAGIVKDKFTIIEATTHGVKETDLIDFMMTKDKIALVQPKFASIEEMKAASLVAMEQLGKPYQFDMEFTSKNVKAFYCSMLCYYSYLKACSVMPFTLRKTLGIATVSPTDFILASDKFEVVWQSSAK